AELHRNGRGPTADRAEPYMTLLHHRPRARLEILCRQVQVFCRILDVSVIGDRGNQMDGRFSGTTSGIASMAMKVLTALTNVLRKGVAVDARPYRPEAHYMRGPGPKWRAAHARSRDPAVR